MHPCTCCFQIRGSAFACAHTNQCTSFDLLRGGAAITQLAQIHDENDIIFVDNSKDQLTEVYDILKSFGGSPSAEHGIGKRKKEIWNEFPQYKQKLELLKTLKKSIDPEGIIAPKVFFD